jgi:hypothetical protein
MSVTDLNREQRRDAQRQLGGFKPERTLYRLNFEDPQYQGLVVEMTGLKVGLFMEVAELGDFDAARLKRAGASKVLRVFDIVAGGLHQWNVIDDAGEPVPASLDGIKTQEFPFILMLLEQWMAAVGSVPGPLEQPSAAGKLSALPVEINPAP